MIGFLPGLFGNHEVRCVEVNRIDALGFHELENFHVVARRWRYALHLFVAYDYVSVFLDLVPLHQLASLYHSLAMRTVSLLLNPAATYFMNLVEADALCARRRVQPDRNRDQAESNVAFPNS